MPRFDGIVTPEEALCQHLRPLPRRRGADSFTALE